MGRYMCDPRKNSSRRMNDRDKGRYMDTDLQHASGDGLFLESRCFGGDTVWCPLHAHQTQ